MMSKIQTEVNISSAHVVHTTDSKCSNIHGHNWKIIVTVKGDVGGDGMVIDFNDIKQLINNYDHKLLLPLSDDLEIKYDDINLQFYIGDKYYSIPKSDIALIDIPVITAEYLAQFFAQEIKNMVVAGVTIRVYESEKSYAEVEYD